MSEVSVCNMGLAYIGAQPITTLTENTECARRLNAIYDETRKELLRLHPWNFAIGRATLARLADDPLFEYEYYYQLPTDFLKMLVVSDGTNQLTDWKLESDKLAIDETTVKIKYIKDVTDDAQWDDAFRMAMAYRLAADICFAITGKGDLAQALHQMAEEKLRIARSLDAQESGATEEIDKDLWTIENRE